MLLFYRDTGWRDLSKSTLFIHWNFETLMWQMHVTNACDVTLKRHLETLMWQMFSFTSSFQMMGYNTGFYFTGILGGGTCPSQQYSFIEYCWLWTGPRAWLITLVTFFASLTYPVKNYLEQTIFIYWTCLPWTVFSSLADYYLLLLLLLLLLILNI